MIGFILPLVLAYRYWALFGITFIAALILPVPPGTLIMASSALAYQGYFDFRLVLLAAITGNILGDNLGYWLARTYGVPVLSRIGFRKVLASKRFKEVELLVHNRPGFILFISRFEVFTNLAVNLIAGLSKVPYRKYALFVAIGEICQVTLYGSIGYFFGSNWERIGAAIGHTFLIILVVLIVVLAIFWKRIMRSLRKRST